MPRIEGLLTGRQLLALPETATVLEAAQFMHHHLIGAVLVTDDGQGVRGIFTERDLMSRVVVPGLLPGEVRLSEVMTREVFTAPREAKVADIRRELQHRHIRHVPVVDGARAIAMLSLRDLLSADLAATKFEKRALSESIKGSVDQQG